MPNFLNPPTSLFTEDCISLRDFSSENGIRQESDRKREYYSAMRHSTGIALLLSGLALPACAQHGGGHGGFSGHAGGASPAFHSGFAASRPSAPASASRPQAMRPGDAGMHRPTSMRYGAQPLHYGANSGYGINSGRGVQDGHRPPYRRPDRGGIIYNYPYGGLGNYYYGSPYGLGFYGDDWDNGYDTSDSSNYQDAPYYAPDQYNGFDPQAQGPGYAEGQPQAWPPDQGSGPAPGPGMAQLNPDTPYRPYYGTPHPVAVQPAAQPAVTLVFKDHRPNQQIHNYLINGDTITVWDQHPHEIALDQLDIAATEKINHDAGNDLFLPVAPQ